MPIQFACPHCGKQTTVAVIAVVLVGGLLVCGGVIVAVAFPMYGQVRTSAQRMTSQNNLKQLGVAIHAYHDAFNALPPAVVMDASGKPLYSGLVLLLPFMEQDGLYRQFDQSKAWNDPANEHLSAISIPMFQNPASISTAAGHCDYRLVGGANAVLADNGQKSTLMNILYGLSNTIMAVEVGSSGATKSWAEPQTWDSSQTFDSPHPTVVNVLFADGSVRALQKTIPMQTLRLLSDRQDGQAVNVP